MEKLPEEAPLVKWIFHLIRMVSRLVYITIFWFGENMCSTKCNTQKETKVNK